MAFGNEREFETHIRNLIHDNITDQFPHIYALDNKKAVDILICRDQPEPKLFFIEVKFHKASLGRLGFGSTGGRGFQPEILQKQPAYFEQNMRWIIGNEANESEEFLFLTSETIRGYVAGGVIGDKQNNIQERIFSMENHLNKKQFLQELEQWLTT